MIRQLILHILFLSLLLPTFVVNARKPKRYFKQEVYLQQLGSMHKKYGVNKSFPKKYELQCLIALSFYPSLDSVPVEFVYKKIKTTMASRPKPDFIIKSNHQTVYRIVINQNTKKQKAVCFDDLPFNAQVGVIGHELAHIIDYREKNDLGIIGTGIKYIFSKKYKRSLEHKIDSIAIRHGLGWQVYDFSYYIIHFSGANKKYLSIKKAFYLSPRDILNYMKQLSGIYYLHFPYNKFCLLRLT